MLEVKIPITDDLLLASGQSPQEMEDELRLLLAIKLFEVGRVSVGKAAEVAGLPKLRFMDELGRLKIPVINLSDDQILDELSDG